MAHITSIGAGVYSALAVNTTAITNITTADTLTELVALFSSAAGFKEVKNVREFPQIGTPANIVNVPTYGQKTSQQIQGQSDAPTLEITVNYVAEDMQAIHALIDGQEKLFRFMMAGAAVTQDEGAASTLAVENTEFYFVGKVEAILVNPSLSDSITATVTLSAQSDFFGPATVAAA